ncbi:MAG: hypothetical protein ACR2IH_13345, partial [Pyrinomonadaceae bacterium]
IFDTEGHPIELAAAVGSKSDEPAAEVAGKWIILLDFQGQQVPVTMTLEQDQDAISGSLETPLGSGPISEGRVSGKKLKATSNLEIQGQPVDFTILGTIEDGMISGEISSEMVPAPLTFTGTREA